MTEVCWQKKNLSLLAKYMKMSYFLHICAKSKKCLNDLNIFSQEKDGVKTEFFFHFLKISLIKKMLLQKVNFLAFL